MSFYSDDRLQNISILTSTTNSVPPCRNCLQWAEQSYQVESYGPVGIILFSSQIYARYVAVYRSTPNSSLALAEVEIYVSGKKSIASNSFSVICHIYAL